MNIFRPVWAEVDLGALRRNLKRIQQYAGSEIMPIVKADAYGHGAVEVVRTLKEEGITRFGVAILEEALELRRELPDIALMVIGPTLSKYSEILVKEEIIPEIFQIEQAEALSAAALKLNKTARLHIKVDTGMGRTGFRENVLENIQKIAKLPGLYLEGIYTHLATADSTDLSYAKQQLKIFDDLYEKLCAAGIKIPIRHVANSAAIMQIPESHYELCRPGIILYGLLPMDHAGQEAGFEPVMSLKTRISQLKTIEEGESVGYGRTFIADRPTKVATLPIGYGDGLRRSLSNGGEVLLKGKKARIIGKICMDQIMVDVTEIKEIQEGDEAVLLGRNGDLFISADRIAEQCGTISYEILCGISKRVPRVMVESK
ncbi:MAG: alanine racemase [Dehalobacter sp. 4CP]|uniref:alanine racemase n=1 Tax=Dehalobacter sp. CP TaxID=2594474 RepID=UPI0013C72001|nr:alanine racemase [Dehalobacter sp. 4CP]